LGHGAHVGCSDTVGFMAHDRVSTRDAWGLARVGYRRAGGAAFRLIPYHGERRRALAELLYVEVTVTV
jgi:hypothetical protein